MIFQSSNVFWAEINGKTGSRQLSPRNLRKTSVKDIETMYLLKTGALFSVCFNLLLTVKKLSTQKRKNLKVIGDTIGKIFQVTDDMLKVQKLNQL